VVRKLDINHYVETDLERWIEQQYLLFDIHTPHDLSIRRVAEVFQIAVSASNRETKVYHDDEGNHLLFLNSRKAEIEQRAEFFHELCHVIRHTGIQHSFSRSYIELQEIQANQFRLYAAMPYYMIVSRYSEMMKTMDITPLMAHDFQLPIWLIHARLDQIIRRIQRYSENQIIYNNVPRQSLRIIEHSSETVKLIGKLSWLAAQKGRKINWEG
jgi:Zn-dependent peptidase ImmA (M78 family)